MECWGGKKYPLSNINCEIYFLCIYDILYFTKKKKSLGKKFHQVKEK